MSSPRITDVGGGIGTSHGTEENVEGIGTAGFGTANTGSLPTCETAKVSVFLRNPFHPPWWGQRVADVGEGEEG